MTINFFAVYSLHRTTVLAAAAFLDAFQKVADMATNTRGTFFNLKVEVTMINIFVVAESF